MYPRTKSKKYRGNLSAVSPQDIRCDIYTGRIKPVISEGLDKYCLLYTSYLEDGTEVTRVPVGEESLKAWMLPGSYIYMYDAVSYTHLDVYKRQG